MGEREREIERPSFRCGQSYDTPVGTENSMPTRESSVGHGCTESDISATAGWVRAAGADIARFGEARPLPSEVK